MPVEIFLNLENINIMLTTVIANINTSLAEFNSTLGLATQDDIVKDLDIVIDTFLNSKPEVLDTIKELKKSIKSKNKI